MPSRAGSATLADAPVPAPGAPGREVLRSFLVETWGCQMNVHDSERLAGQLVSLGLVPAASAEDADVVVLNTCSVRERAAQKVVSRIGELSCRPRPPLIGVCGCVGEQEGAALMQRSRAVGFVIGPGHVDRLAEVVAASAAGRRPVLTGFDQPAAATELPVARRPGPRGMVTVIEGCSQRCTFCVVPFTRGPEVSRPLAAIVDEAAGLIASGVREIELLGQTVNAYCCPRTGTRFASLLATVADLPGLARVRFVTSHPRLFDDELIDVIATHDRVSRYLHLPLQAGSDRILRRMARRYRQAEYLDLVGRIRARVPDANLSTDIIVGFPGETEADFSQTLDVLERVRFGQVFAFAFSPRPRTPAARCPDQVSDEVRRDRLHRLFALTDRISGELNQAMLGRVVRVLVDGPSRRSSAEWQGRGEDNRVVNFPHTAGVGVGDLVEVRVTGATAHSLRGEPLAAPPGDAAVASAAPGRADAREGNLAGSRDVPSP